ncbi:MAG: InlB B-repeat-containing protein [Clostridia bacterium]|nr:InlB B-repeat-containing protein [Clostridia bacterium]
MKKKFTKILSVLLAVVITISIIPFTAIETKAATNSMVEAAINWAVSIANDNRYGYILGANHSWSSSTDYDCSSLVTTAFKKAGFGTWVTTTHYMRSMFEKAGFKWIPKSELGGLTTSTYLQRGDILLNEKYHTEIYLGNNKLVGAHMNYNGYAGGQGGGQWRYYNSGKAYRTGADEINISNYYSYPWDGVLRYVGNDTKPAAPSTPTMNSIGKTDVAQGSNVTLSWSAASNATSYILKIQSNTINQEINVGNTTSYAYNLPDAQTYTFSVKAKGGGGESSYSSTFSCTAHEPSTVTFLDWDGKELEKVGVKYGENVKSPEIPTRKGYTFSSWDSSYYNITSDKTINAVYKINTYTVNFIGANDEILKTEKVNYGESATPPTDTKSPEGYVFHAWENEDYKDVYVEYGTTLNVNAVYLWENPDIPIVCSNATAARQDDGYYVYFDLQNYPNDVTKGRAVVSLKTADDKLVDMSESAAFSIPAGGTKTGMEVFIPSDKAATSVEIVIVNSYSSGVPISEKVTTVVTNDDMWSDWTDTTPEYYDKEYIDVEERTLYQYAEKVTETGNTPTKDGWTYTGQRNEILQSETGYQDATVDTYDNETGRCELTGTQTVDIQEYVPVYLYYHFYNPSGGSDGQHYWCPTMHGNQGYNNEWGKWTYHSKEVWYNPLSKAGTSSCGSYQKYGYMDCGICKDKTFWSNTFWFLNNNFEGFTQGQSYLRTTGTKTQYKYATYRYEYIFWKWGDFSEWLTTPVTETDEIDVNTKTQYRYYSAATTAEDNIGVERTISSAKYGTLPAFAGKQLSLFIYKVDGASDYTNEYIGQTEIDENGDYSFTFKLREEPTVKTGDYTVAIGIEGTTDLIVIDTIEAPTNEYTVKFFNWEGNVISTQTIKEGNNALLPENPVKEGYVFKGWDTSVANISQDLEIHPVFEKETYSIIFVDWTTQSIVVEEYSCGDIITPPENSTMVGYDFSGWDMLNDGTVVATSDMVITAVYDKKVFNVSFYDFDGNVISTQRVAYGDSAETPILGEGENGEQFAGWNNAEDFMDVSHDVAFYPVY